MAKKILIGVLFFLIFLTSVGISYQFVNRDNQELTMELSEPTIPTMQLLYDGSYCNTLYGYTEEMDMVAVADKIIDVGLDRTIAGSIFSKGDDVESISLQLRNMDASRLIEERSIEYTDESLAEYAFSFSFNDLIELDQEYILHFIVSLASGETIHYYTRFWYVEESVTTQQIAYLMNFHDNCFDDTMLSEVAKVIETSSSQPNTDLSYTNIYSSTDQVMFGSLNVLQMSDAELDITFLDEQYGGYTLSYYAMTKESGVEYYYKVVEKYLLRTVGENIYLMDFERTMDTLIDLERFVFEGDTIDLGVTLGTPDIYESDDGKMSAFVKNNCLYLYDDNENHFKLIYNNYVNTVDDVMLSEQQDIKVLRIDESGSMYFLVYGYFNSGRYEGNTGVIIYSYDGTGNIIKEIGMVMSDQHASLVMQEIEEMSYLNGDGDFYFLFEGNICRYYIDGGEAQVWIPYTQDATLTIAPDQSSILISYDDVVYLYDMEENASKEFATKSDEVAIVQGYIGDDYLYGLAKKDDYIINEDGTYSYLMYKLIIESVDGKIKKEYEEADILIEDTVIEGTQIIINRLQETEDGYQDISNDYIMSNNTLKTASNTIESLYLSNYQTVLEVDLLNNVNNTTLERLVATQLLYEGNLVIDFEIENSADYYLVSAGYERKSYTTDSGQAVIAAAEAEGFSRDSTGSYLWKNETLYTVNQIMAIVEPEVSDASASLAVCLDTMLWQMNNARETAAELEQGLTCQEILSSSMLDYDFLDLTGASMKNLLYYVSQDIPVLALLEDGEAVLITGYNQYNVVIFEPSTGGLYKMGINDASEWFEENGNRFMTYYRYESN
ncbi:MAG: hypothetical protein R3Y47_00970 [Lachnospiraceae bacterium]